MTSSPVSESNETKNGTFPIIALTQQQTGDAIADLRAQVNGPLAHLPNQHDNHHIGHYADHAQERVELLGIDDGGVGLQHRHHVRSHRKHRRKLHRKEQTHDQDQRLQRVHLQHHAELAPQAGRHVFALIGWLSA